MILQLFASADSDPKYIYTPNNISVSSAIWQMSAKNSLQFVFCRVKVSLQYVLN